MNITQVDTILREAHRKVMYVCMSLKYLPVESTTAVHTSARNVSMAVLYEALAHIQEVRNEITTSQS